MLKEALIVIRGPIGVGKTTVSRATYEHLADHASIVETDAIKRMIDPTGSSQWRREIAHASAAFIIERLLQVPRTGIIEMHTKYPAALDRLSEIAERHDARLMSVLLTAPLEVCQQRVASRLVPDIDYSIDRAMVTDYYCNLETMPGDVVYDTTRLSPSDISSDIIGRLA